MLVLQLSKENLPLAAAEATALCPAKHELLGEFLLVDAAFDATLQRLAFTRRIGELLFQCEANMLVQHLESFEWQQHIHGSFAVHLIHSHIPAKDIADRLWRSLPTPKIDLRNPDTRIVVAFTKGSALCMVEKWQQSEDFMARRPHLRPAHHPSSMNPKLARALVNLSGSKTSIVDPFCGSGGILLEAGLMGLECAGFDVDAAMIERARKNLSAFGVKALLEMKDALTLASPVDYIVTDFPYGRNTRRADGLYEAFFKLLGKILCKRAVVMFDCKTDIKKLVKMSGLNMENEFSWYVHRSLTRKIVVLTG